MDELKQEATVAAWDRGSLDSPSTKRLVRGGDSIMAESKKIEWKESWHDEYLSSDSTKQQLRGKALTNIMLSRSG